jgi:hypothetical protein
MSAPDDLDLRLALTEALDRIDALETEVRELRSPAPPAAPTTVRPIDPPDIATPPTVDRRRLLGRAGTVALGAVLGGTVATVTAASPAAAASGSFDSNSLTPALDATNTSNGDALHLTAQSGSGLVVRTTGPNPAVDVKSTEGVVTLGVEGVETSTGIYSLAKYFGVIGQATSFAGMGARGEAPMIGVAGKGTSEVPGFGVGVAGYSPERVGMWAWGKAASILLGPGRGFDGDPPEESPSPRGSTIEHERGELVFDSNSDLWLCVADGTPGTWIHLGGPASSGTFTVLHRPVRVYNATAVTGIIHGIDLTTASSGVPTDATAAVITVNITNTTAQANSFCKVFADDLTTPPPTTAVRWRDAKELIANSVTTRLAAAKIATQINGQANLAIDVVGYYR